MEAHGSHNFNSWQLQLEPFRVIYCVLYQMHNQMCDTRRKINQIIR
jgi:hypothetical protein